MKARKDKEKANVLNRHVLAIISAVRTGGTDEGKNPLLTSVLQRANKANVPKDKIKSAIAKGSGEAVDGKRVEEIVYEVEGLGGLRMILEVITDNRNRFLQEIRGILNKHQGKLAKSGSVLRCFDYVGVYKQTPLHAHLVDEYLDHILTEDVLDISVEDDQLEVLSPPKSLTSIQSKISKLNEAHQLEGSQVDMEYLYLPKDAFPTVELSPTLEEIISTIDNLPEVKSSYHNAYESYP